MKKRIALLLVVLVMVSGCIFGSDKDDKKDEFSIAGTWYNSRIPYETQLTFLDNGIFSYVNIYSWYGTYTYNPSERKGVINFSSGGEAYNHLRNGKSFNISVDKNDTLFIHRNYNILLQGCFKITRYNIIYCLRIEL